MTNHGGARKGAGRKPSGKIIGKRVTFYVYPDEVEKIKEFIKKLRA